MYPSSIHTYGTSSKGKSGPSFIGFYFFPDGRNYFNSLRVFHQPNPAFSSIGFLEEPIAQWHSRGAKHSKIGGSKSTRGAYRSHWERSINKNTTFFTPKYIPYPIPFLFLYRQNKKRQLNPIDQQSLQVRERVRPPMIFMESPSFALILPNSPVICRDDPEENRPYRVDR
jgi:hypothetical protein